MKLLHQYLRLAQGLPATSSQSIEGVAQRLGCTSRNARLLLGRMREKGWLQWTPGRGRGKLSLLELRRECAGQREVHRLSLIGYGRLEEAFDNVAPRERSRLELALPTFLGPVGSDGLRIPISRPLGALDPIHVTDRIEAQLVTRLYDGLTCLDSERDCVMPSLAERWQCLDGGCRWQFWLRAGLRFHDDRQLRPEDAAASLYRLRDTPGPHSALMANLRDATISGNYLELVLAEADPQLPYRLTHHSTAVLPADDWHRPDFESAPIGAGAYRLVRKNEVRATLAAYEGYWRGRPPVCDIDLWVITTGASISEIELPSAIS